MPERKEILIFANPIAGRGRGLSIARRLETRFRSEGYAVMMPPKRPEELEPGDLPAAARAAVVIGGDGTLRAVADRLCTGCGGEGEGEVGDGVTAYRGDGVRSSPSLPHRHIDTPLPRHPPPPPRVAGPPLLVVPLGTANLMGRHLGIKCPRPAPAIVQPAGTRHRYEHRSCPDRTGSAAAVPEIKGILIYASPNAGRRGLSIARRLAARL